MTTQIPRLADLKRRWAEEAIRNRLAVNAKDGSILVYVPPGEFEMGDGEGSNCPKHRVRLSGYWIGVTAVSNAQYGKFVAATRYQHAGSSGSGQATHPVAGVSWDDARAYAEWAGGELPTEAQWERAARGPLGLKYPWGEAWDAARCRNKENRGGEETAPASGYPGGVSGYGTYNQSGNVWEWCRDWHGENYYESSPRVDPEGPSGGSGRVIRGGCWWCGDPARFRGAYRGRDAPRYRYLDHGFRLVRTASGPLPS